MRRAAGVAAVVALLAGMAQAVSSRWHGTSADRAQSAAARARPAPGLGQTRATLSVPDLWCGGCAAASELALRRLPGVQAVVSRLDTRQIIVDYDPARVHQAELVSAVASAGFTATVVGCHR
jgi:copper chaperone CopZ